VPAWTACWALARRTTISDAVSEAVWLQLKLVRLVVVAVSATLGLRAVPLDWFALAAQHGDPEARKALAELAPPKPRATPAAPRAAIRPAAVRRAAPAASPNVRQAQLILTRLGYFDGPTDGVVTDAYRVALFRYQQDQRDQAAVPRPYAAR